MPSQPRTRRNKLGRCGPYDRNSNNNGQERQEPAPRPGPSGSNSNNGQERWEPSPHLGPSGSRSNNNGKVRRGRAPRHGPYNRNSHNNGQERRESAPRPGPSWLNVSKNAARLTSKDHSRNSPDTPVRTRRGNRKRKSSEMEDKSQADLTESSRRLKTVCSAEAANERLDSPTAGEQEKDFEEIQHKYQIQGPIDKGGNGTVYAGVRLEDNEPVAVKLIPKDEALYRDVEIDGEIRQIPHEVFILDIIGSDTQELASNRCVRLLDWYEWGSMLALVLERPENCQDLFNYCHHNSKIRTNTMKAIFRDLVDGTLFMVSKGIFHEDIKPENVLVEMGTKTPRAWIIDFGNSSVFGATETVSTMCGTLAYYPPEYFRQSSIIPEAATVWQLGATLYYLVFRRQLLKTRRAIASMRAVRLPCYVRPELRDLLKGCLHKIPQKRLTLKEMRDHPWLNQ